MKQTIEIDVPDGKIAIWKDNKVVFEDIKPQFPKTWEEFCKQNEVKKNEYYLDTSSCIIVISDSKRYSGSDRNLLPSKEAAEAHLALMQLHQLRDCYRQGWEPDWNDNYDKYIIVKNRDKYVVFGGNWTNQFLSFQDRERAEEFLDNFRDLIEQAGDLI